MLQVVYGLGLDEFVSHHGGELFTDFVSACVKLAGDAGDLVGVDLYLRGGYEAAGLDGVAPGVVAAAGHGLQMHADVGVAFAVGELAGVDIEFAAGENVAGVVDCVGGTEGDVVASYHAACEVGVLRGVACGEVLALVQQEFLLGVGG